MRKKCLVLLSLVMLIPQVSFASTETQQLEQILEKVKESVQVPEAFTEFSYNKWGDLYQLMWQDELGEEGSLNVGCESDGTITSYALNIYDEKESHLGKVDRETGQIQAALFLKEVAPEYANDLVLRETKAPSQDYQYTYVYDLYHQGVKVYNQVVTVEVSKETGEVRRFSGIDFDQRDYSSNTPKLTQKQAEQKYLEQMPLEAIYKNKYDWKTGNRDNFLVYEVSNMESKAIDALSGTLIKAYERENDFKEGVSENQTTSDMAKEEERLELTPSEKKALEETKGLLEVKDIQQKVGALFPRVKSAVVDKNRLYKQQDQYIRQLTFKEEANKATIYLTVNAQTGEVKNYAYWRDEVKEEMNYSWQEKEAAAFLNKVAPEAFKETKLIEHVAIDNEATEQPFINYYYGRLANGYLVEGDGLSVTYDRRLGEVCSYTKNWDQTTFKTPQNIISKEEALHLAGLELVYMETEENKYSLAYTTKERMALIDAFTGEQMDYSGKAIKEEVQQFYTDVKGHPQEAIIKKLFDSGIYLKGTKLLPNTPISERDFLELLCQVTQGRSLEEKDDQDKWIKEVTGGSGNGETLTREKAVYELMNTTAYKKIAGVSELYSYPFKDKDYEASLKGYISLAYGLKLIQKDQTELFKPKAQLTRAEALELMYYLILSQEQ